MLLTTMANDHGGNMAATGSGQSIMWLRAPSPLRFPVDRVDIWKVHLDQTALENSDANVLSKVEQARASRFHFEKDRIHFTRCRSTLRHLLALYLTIPSAQIQFEYLAGGKPQLAPAQNPNALQFNVSHSGGMALIAIGSQHRLGVDIEKMRRDIDAEVLAERFFSGRERAGLRTLPEGLRVRGFFACWTRKEAFLKATGTGLSFPLADFSVTTHPDREPELEEVEGDFDAGKQWLLKDLSVGDEHHATIAIEDPQARIETYRWN
jgi:4'-phosphopantetheinyl transferase